MTLRPLSLVLCFLPLLAASAQAQEDEGAVSVLILRTDGPGRRAPLPGARVSCWTEDSRPTSLASRLVAEARADEFGVAELRVPPRKSYHWLIEAKGWGVLHEYGGTEALLAEEIVFEEPGKDRSLRIVGPFGRPLAGARVEMLLGCSHGPAARVATSDAQGIAVLPDVSDSGWDLYIVAKGVRPRSYSLPQIPMGDKPPVVITTWGATATGMVVDEKGEPIEGAVVRELDGFRGPVTATGADGTFVLHGLSAKDEIGVFLPDSPFAPRPDTVARGFTENVPLRFVVRKDRPTALGEDEPRHRLDVVVEKANSFVPLRLVRPSDGLTITRSSNLWIRSFDLPAGMWDIIAGGGFSSEEATRSFASVPTPGAPPATIRLVRHQAGFGIRPHAEETAKKGEIRIPGFSKEMKRDEIVWIPTEAPAGLFLSEPHERVVPVPVAKDGYRFLNLPLPGETRLRLRVTNPRGEVLAARVDAPKGFRVQRSGEGLLPIATSRAGAFQLTVSADGYIPRDVDVVLPPPPAEIDLGMLVLRPVTDRVTRTFRIARADGSPLGDFAVRTPTGDLDGTFADEPGRIEVEFIEDIPVAIDAEGFLPLPTVLTRTGPEEIRFPGGRLTIRVLDEEGKPLDATTWVDGFPFESEDGPIIVDGVPAGIHAIVVIAEDGRVATRRVTLAKEGHRTEVIQLSR
jgi:hypothetical protein